MADFGKLWGNKNTAKSIFEIQVHSDESPYNFFGFDIFVDSVFKFPKRNIASKSLIDAFAAAGNNCARYKATINFAVTPESFNMPANAWNPAKAIPFMFKYLDPNGFASDDNIVIIRLAYIILLAAKANVQLGNLDLVANWMNQIKKRAGLPNTTAKSKNELALTVLNEKKLELVFECTR